MSKPRCIECNGAGIVTRPGSIDVNEWGQWTREEMDCLTCT